MDFCDRASAREEELRQDALAAMDLHRNGLHSLSHCERCDKPIPKERQRAIEGVSTCVGCQTLIERGTR
jgi:phage/conjugal plasmid C-4 type zinc finger TraR family protein